MRARSSFLAAVCLLLSLSAAVHAQPNGGRPEWIDSLTEPDEGLAVRGRSGQTGHVTFASSPGKGLLLQPDPGASAEARALRFVDTYGRPFGLTNRAQVRHVRTEVDDLGVEHVRMQQVHEGVPVTGGEFIVHLKGARVLAANGRAISDLPQDVLPAVQPEIAKSLARQLIAKRGLNVRNDATYSEPRLEVLNRAFVADSGTDRSRLAWFIEVRALDLRQYIWIDAQTRALLFTFSQLTDAKSRKVYSANNTSTLPGALVRTEGGAATLDPDSDNAYDFAGVTYDYFLNTHGRDSYDGLGAQIISTTHYCSPAYCPGNYPNAFWNGTQMVYGNGYASADDVVGHELAHAVTEKTAGLFYYQQSGALNESFSDIFGEAIDLGSSLGTGNDTAGARWYMGEDIGAIRNMMNPNLFSNPARMNDPYFWCTTNGWTDPDADRGGVHINSGIPNHAFALMVDGGTFNGKTIAAIGMLKAAKIQYRALSTYLVSGSNFIDDYHALNQSCTDLVGTSGITAADCTQVKNAIEAVEMHLPWGCQGSTQAPALCVTGTPSFVFNDGFEAGIGNWTPSTPVNVGEEWGGWFADQGFAKSGVKMVFGSDPGFQTTHTFTKTTGVVVPAGGRMYFDHLFEFENDFSGNYDGGRLEYSLNGGPWIDANALIDGGHAYDGTLVSWNPFGAVPAFVGASYGYVGTRLNLGAFAGQSIRFRFLIASDQSVGSLGWLLDNVGIYSCVVQQPKVFTDDPLVAGVTRVKAVHITELRTRINAIRVARGAGAKTWTNTVATGDPIRAFDILEMRTALNQAYAAAGLTPPSYTDTLAVPTAVRALHVTQLRAAVVAIE